MWPFTEPADQVALDNIIVHLREMQWVGMTVNGSIVLVEADANCCGFLNR
jgi:hypothetical protein